MTQLEAPARRNIRFPSQDLSAFTSYRHGPYPLSTCKSGTVARIFHIFGITAGLDSLFISVGNPIVSPVLADYVSVNVKRKNALNTNDSMNTQVILTHISLCMASVKRGLLSRLNEGLIIILCLGGGLNPRAHSIMVR
jgi:hypothetical protein